MPKFKFLKPIVYVIVLATTAFAQIQTPTLDETIKIPTEEVHLNVTAQTAGGKFVPNLQADDTITSENYLRAVGKNAKIKGSVFISLPSD